MPDPVKQRSAVLLWLFGWYLRWYFHRRFHAVRVARTALPQVPHGKRLIIYSNHPSWWDPALFIVTGAMLLPDRVGFGPMEAGQLRRYGLLRRMGVFGIDQISPRGAAAFLRVSRQVLDNPRHCLWITAQGQFADHRQRPVMLRPGIAHLARHVPDVVFLPLAIEYVFWNESRPEALLGFGPPVAPEPQCSVTETTAMLASALTMAMDKLAADSMARDPARFLPLVRGTVGIGGIYDIWRHLRAWASGRRFDAAHGSTAARAGGGD